MTSGDTDVLSRIGDYHVHIRFSCDSETALAAACQAAIARGLRGDAGLPRRRWPGGAPPPEQRCP